MCGGIKHVSGGIAWGCMICVEHEMHELLCVVFAIMHFYNIL